MPHCRTYTAALPHTAARTVPSQLTQLQVPHCCSLSRARAHYRTRCRTLSYTPEHCRTLPHCRTMPHCRALPHTFVRTVTPSAALPHTITRSATYTPLPLALPHTTMLHCHTLPRTLSQTAALPHTAAVTHTTAARTATHCCLHCRTLPHTHCRTLPHIAARTVTHTLLHCRTQALPLPHTAARIAAHSHSHLPCDLK